MPDNAIVAGIPYVTSLPHLTSGVTAGQLCTSGAPSGTIRTMTTADLDTDVLGIALADRLPGDGNASVPVCITRGVIVPMLHDGALPLAPGNYVGRSTLTAGRIARVTTGGIGIALNGSPATPGLVSVLFLGAAGSFAGGTLTSDITMASGGAVKSPNGLNKISFYDSLLVLDAAGMRPGTVGTQPLGGGGFYWSEVGVRLISFDAPPTVTFSVNTIAPTRQLSFLGAGLIKTITVPAITGSTSIRLIPTAAFTWDATGNIALAGTATISRIVQFDYDSAGAKWYPSYVI